MIAPFANQNASRSEFERALSIAAGVDQGRRGSVLMSGDNYHKKLLTLQRLRRAQTAIAYAMSLDGPVYGPIFERLEREISAIRAAEDVMDRARRLLEGPVNLPAKPRCEGYQGSLPAQPTAGGEPVARVCRARLLSQSSPRLLQA